MGRVLLKLEPDGVARLERTLGLKVDNGNDQDKLAIGSGHVDMLGRAHELGHLDGALKRTLLALFGKQNLLGTYAGRDLLHVAAVPIKGELSAGLGGQRDIHVVGLDGKAVARAHQLGIEEVHLRHADEAGDEDVRGMVEDLLRRGDLLDNAVLHDHDTVAESHGLGLVVSNIDERALDLVAQLDELGTHLVTQLGVQVGQRLVHQEDLRITHDGAADSDTLALAARKRLGLAVEVLGDTQDLGSGANLAVDLVFGDLLELKRKRHVLVHRHVGVQSIALEHHGDVAVLGRHVVDALAVDEHVARGNVLQAGDHAHRRGLTAARRANEDDELLVVNGEVEVLYSEHAVLGNLEVVLLLLGLLLFAKEALLFGLGVGIHLLNMFENDLGHVFTFRCAAPR